MCNTRLYVLHPFPRRVSARNSEPASRGPGEPSSRARHVRCGRRGRRSALIVGSVDFTAAANIHIHAPKLQLPVVCEPRLISRLKRETLSAVIDVEAAAPGRRGRTAGRTNKNGNYCNLRAVGGQLGGPAPALLALSQPYLISEATAKLSSQEVHSSNLYYYLRRL